MMKTILKYFLFVMVLVVSSCDERIIGFDMFTVSVRSDGYGSVAIYGTYDKSLDLWNGSELTVIATTAANYDFLGWFVGTIEKTAYLCGCSLIDKSGHKVGSFSIARFCWFVRWLVQM